MGSHLIEGQFQSDKYPTTPRGKVPLSVRDPMAQDLLWEYAQRRRAVDPEFSSDLETALKNAGHLRESRMIRELAALERLASCVKDGVLQMRDVDRASVYSKHLGEKLRPDPKHATSPDPKPHDD